MKAERGKGCSLPIGRWQSEVVHVAETEQAVVTAVLLVSCHATHDCSLAEKEAAAGMYHGGQVT